MRALATTNRSTFCPSITAASFETEDVRMGGGLTPEQTAEIAAAKQVIYDGFQGRCSARECPRKGRHFGR